MLASPAQAGVVGSEFQVNAYTGARYPAVVSTPSGGFIVVWSSSHDGSSFGTFGQRYDSTGAAVGSEFQINTYTTSGQSNADVAVEHDGDFVVVWQSSTQDGSFNGIFGQRFASSGAPRRPSSRSTCTPRATSSSLPWRWTPTATSSWCGLTTPGATAASAAPSASASARAGRGSVPSSGSTRTRATLIGGAVGGGCTRCDGPSIETYIASILGQLDVDGDGGAPMALTDGLLILRYLFGFRGAILISGAVGGGCTRCDAPSIEAYIAGLL